MDDGLARRFADFARTSRSRSPLYGALAGFVAADPALVDLLRVAPLEQREPVLLLAAIHHLVLQDPAAPLAAYYPTAGGDRAPDDGAALALSELCRGREHDLRELVATRQTQTNEVGRCALFLPALGMIEAGAGPLALLDVGASAGLNLHLDRYHYRYEGGDGAVEVGPDSRVRLDCGTRGAPTLPGTMPVVAARWGLDRAPVDVRDPDAVRWLEACVWADQLDRFERLQAAVEVARAATTEVLTGDAVEAVDGLVRHAATFAHPVVTSSWVLGYLSPTQRVAFVERLDDVARDLDLDWVYAESPAMTDGLPTPGVGVDEPSRDLTALVHVRWRAGVRSARRLATCHPHGFWMHWHG